MRKRHTFRPESLGPLEDRLALSGAAATMHAPAAVVANATVRALATTRPDRATVGYEVNFLKGMVPHHQMAIDMSKLALRYATDPQVKDLARRIISEQRPEIARMQRYLAVDGVRNYRPGKDAAALNDLKALGSRRGNAFNVAFLTMMTDHHTRAIQGDGMGMIGAAEANGRVAQPGLKQLTAQIVSTQSRELMEMQGYLARGG